MKIPSKFNMNHSSIKNDGFKKQTCETFNQLIDCITELKKENKGLKDQISNLNSSHYTSLTK